VRQTMVRPRGRDALAVSQGAELGGLGGATGASASSPLLQPRMRKTLPKPKYMPQQPVVTVEAEVEEVQVPLLVVGISESHAAASASASRSAAYAAHQAPMLAGGGCSKPKQHLPLPVPLSSPKLKSWPHNIQPPPPPPPPPPWEPGPHTQRATAITAGSAS
jgi:hypothetical protein